MNEEHINSFYTQLSSNSVNLNEYKKENDNNEINLSLEDEHLTLYFKLKKLQNLKIYTLNMQKLGSLTYNNIPRYINSI